MRQVLRQGVIFRIHFPDGEAGCSLSRRWSGDKWGDASMAGLRGFRRARLGWTHLLILLR